MNKNIDVFGVHDRIMDKMFTCSTYRENILSRLLFDLDNGWPDWPKRVGQNGTGGWKGDRRIYRLQWRTHARLHPSTASAVHIINP